MSYHVWLVCLSRLASFVSSASPSSPPPCPLPPSPSRARGAGLDASRQLVDSVAHLIFESISTHLALSLVARTRTCSVVAWALVAVAAETGRGLSLSNQPISLEQYRCNEQRGRELALVH